MWWAAFKKLFWVGSPNTLIPRALLQLFIFYHQTNPERKHLPPPSPCSPKWRWRWRRQAAAPITIGEGRSGRERQGWHQDMYRACLVSRGHELSGSSEHQWQATDRELIKSCICTVTSLKFCTDATFCSSMKPQMFANCDMICDFESIVHKARLLLQVYLSSIVSNYP